jgi:DNA-binding transcriptional MerR regulator
MAEQRKSPAKGRTGLQVFDPAPGGSYTLEAVCQMTGIARRDLLIYCRSGLIKPLTSGDREPMTFGEESIYLIRRIEYLRTAHGVNIAGIRIVFHLLRELERLRDEIRFRR